MAVLFTSKLSADSYKYFARGQVSALCDSAQAAWEQPNHMLAGWSIFTLGAREISTLYEARHLIEVSAVHHA